MYNSAHTIDKEQNSGNAYLIVIQLDFDYLFLRIGAVEMNFPTSTNGFVCCIDLLRFKIGPPIFLW